MAKRTRVIPAAEFKARCLTVMDEVRRTGSEVTITKHGRPVARLVPAVDDAEPVFGRLAGWVTYEADLIAPIDVAWDADATE